MNQHSKYLEKGYLLQKSDRHKHTGSIALLGPLKWSVNMSAYTGDPQNEATTFDFQHLQTVQFRYLILWHTACNADLF